MTSRTSPCGEDAYRTLLEGVASLPSLFVPGQLAFLTATCKVELPVRDALAFHLHRELGDTAIVGREVARGDIAVLDPAGRVLLRGEHTALYSFDALRTRKLDEYLTKVESDSAKLRKIAQPDEVSYVLTTMTWLGSTCVAPLERAIVKYADGQRRVLKSFGLTHAELGDKGHEIWAGRMERLTAGAVTAHRFDLGDCHDVPIGLDIVLGRVDDAARS